MGLSQSSCVSVTDINKYTKESYTVKRTNGTFENGWIISNSHKNKNGEDVSCALVTSTNAWVNGHACKMDDAWKIFMSSPIDSISQHACGWRRVGTFFPTHLEGKTEEINTWQNSLKDDLNALELNRQRNSNENKRCPHALPYHACMSCSD